MADRALSLEASSNKSFLVTPNTGEEASAARKTDRTTCVLLGNRYLQRINELPTVRVDERWVHVHRYSTVVHSCSNRRVSKLHRITVSTRCGRYAALVVHRTFRATSAGYRKAQVPKSLEYSSRSVHLCKIASCMRSIRSFRSLRYFITAGSPSDKSSPGGDLKGLKSKRTS